MKFIMTQPLRQKALSLCLATSMTLAPISVFAESSPELARVASSAAPTLDLTQPATVVSPAVAEPQNDVVLPAKVTATNTVIPENTTFTASLTQPLLSRESWTGDQFELILDKDILGAEGQVLVPAGSTLHARIEEIKGSKLARVKAKMDVAFYEIITPDGVTIPIEGSINSKTGYLKGNRRKMDAGSVGLMAARQALKIGVQVAAGAAAGYGAGLVLFIALKRGKDVIYKPGEKLPVKLDKAVYITATQMPESTPSGSDAFIPVSNTEATPSPENEVHLEFPGPVCNAGSCSQP